MSAKIDKVCAEINKTKAKISDYQARLRELEKQRLTSVLAQLVKVVPIRS